MNQQKLLRKVICDHLRITNQELLQLKSFLKLNHSLMIKICWFFAIFSCFSISLYQVVDRVLYYFTYPVSVNIEVDSVDEVLGVKFKLCSFENEYLVQNFKPIMNKLDCLLPITAVINSDNVNYKEVWNYPNKSLFMENLLIKNYPKNGSKVFINTTENTIFGHCTVIFPTRPFYFNDTSRELELTIREGKLCQPSFFLFTFEDIINFEFIFPIVSGIKVLLILQVRYFKFENTTTRKCVSSETYRQCIDKCLNNLIIDRIHCSLPFHHQSIKFPECKSKVEAAKSYQNSFRSVLKAGSCKCTKACLRRKINAFTFPTPTNSTKLTLNAKPLPDIVIFTEHLTYPKSSLLVDIGGLLGLFLGLSILSIASNFYTLSDFFFKKVFQNKTKLQLIISPNLQTLVVKLQALQKARQNSTTKTLQTVTLVICVIFAIGVITNAITYYFSYSVRLVVETETLSSIHFPSATLCGLSKITSMFKRKFAKENNITNWCDIHMLDLMDLHKPWTVKTIWEKALFKSSDSFAKVAMKKFNVDLMVSNETVIKTHLGDCRHFKFQEEKYYGMFTVFIFTFIKTSQVDCGENSYLLFFDRPESDSYNILMSSTIPVETHMVFNYHLKTVMRRNSKVKPCIHLAEFNLCKKSCIRNKILEQGLCSLPQYSHLINKTTCNLSSTAKESLQKYVKILLELENNRICKCTSLCTENIVSLDVHNMVDDDDAAIAHCLIFTTYSNIMEYVIEIEKYNIVSLFCDIGNILGLALGTSILSSLNDFYNIIIIFKKAMSKLENFIKKQR